MASGSAVNLKAQLARDLPDALVAVMARSELAPVPPQHGKPSLDTLLATDDAVVQPHAIANVARYLRDTHGYVLLTNLTAVDYLRDNVIELVYHFDTMQGSTAVIKTRVPREDPRLPSLTPFWPGADFQEREAFDLYGVVFEGHQNLRRIYMWDEFEGFPMRKDFPRQGDKYFGEAD